MVSKYHPNVLYYGIYYKVAIFSEKIDMLCDMYQYYLYLLYILLVVFYIFIYMRVRNIISCYIGSFLIHHSGQRFKVRVGLSLNIKIMKKNKTFC